MQSCSRVDWIENFIWIRAKGCFIGPVNDLQRIRMVLESLRARRRVAHQGTPRHTSSSVPAGAFLGLSSFDVLMGRAGRAGRAGLTCTIRRKTPNSILKRPRAASQQDEANANPICLAASVGRVLRRRSRRALALQFVAFTSCEGVTEESRQSEGNTVHTAYSVIGFSVKSGIMSILGWYRLPYTNYYCI